MDLGPFPNADGFAEADQADTDDDLAGFRDRYLITDPDLIYLDGNSLGRLPHHGLTIVEEVVRQEWGDRLIRSWNEGWWDLQLDLGDRIAPIVGAREGEVIVSDSTSVNLYKLALGAVRDSPDRGKIVTDDLNFPTDVYVLEGVARDTGGRLEVIASDGLNAPPLDTLAEAIDKDTSLVSLSHTVFKSGYTYDLAEITTMAHDAGALVLWDCSHSVGALPIDLTGAEVDLAVGCTYKYLNGGPGSPAWLYVRSDLQDRLANPITAWWSHAQPFDFDLDYSPVEGIRRFHTGTMPVLSLAPIAAGVGDVLDAGIDQIRDKSLAMSEYLIGQAELHLSPFGLEVASPREPNHRGSHVSLAHDDAWPLTRALIERGHVIPDFRTPDNIRIGLSPLYNTFLEVHTAIQRLKALVESEAHLEFNDFTALVT